MKQEYSNKLRQYLQTLGQLSESTWTELVQMFSVKRITKGEYFSQRSNRTKKIVFVIKGTFRKFILTEDGNVNILTFIVSNNLVCTSMENESKSSTDIQSLEDSLIIEADYIEFKELSYKFQEIENIHKSFLFKIIQRNQIRENILLSSSGIDKYVQFLNEYENLLNIIPHYHIASYLGITPTQLSRIKKSSTYVNDNSYL